MNVWIKETPFVYFMDLRLASRLIFGEGEAACVCGLGHRSILEEDR